MKKLIVASALAIAFGFGIGVVPQASEAFGIPANVCQAAEAEEEITATGFGALPQGVPVARAKMMARRAAIVDAQRGLVEAIKGTSVDAETTVNMSLLQSDIVKTKVSGIVTGARIISEGMNNDGGYEVTMSVPKYGVGSVADVAITQKLAKEGITAPVPVPAPAPEAVKTYTPAPEAKFAGGYTGVVIDAKGTPLSRTFCPVIYDTNGRAIYGVKNVSADFAIKNGVVEYAEGEARWQQVGLGNTRAGSNPLVVKAVSLRERCVNKCDVVISPEDADKILIENERSGFLGKYAVVFEK